jgi:hypothetical protein
MSSPNHSFARWFKGQGSTDKKASEESRSAVRTSRRSIGLGEFMRSLKGTGEEKLSVLDLGSTSPANIAFLTELGLRVYTEDILRASKGTGTSLSTSTSSSQRISLTRQISLTLFWSGTPQIIFPKPL